MLIGVPKESCEGERRVSITPAALPLLAKAGASVTFEPGCGVAAGFPDSLYHDGGAAAAKTRRDLYAASDVVVQVRALGANPQGWQPDLEMMREDQILVALMDPLSAPQPAAAAARRKVLCFALELLPRITRAQSMDVLSSQANLAGYKAALLAADALPRIFPMMMTAAGTITPARALVIGAGVAGLQAIATARRLGAVVSAYDVRPAVKDQIESLGARFVELPMETAEASGGYAQAMDEAFYARQAELMATVVAESDVVIATAAVPGQKAPILVKREMVEAMRPGSVIVDLAAERGGNCELTRPGETIVHNGVSILGPLNVPAMVAFNASQLYARNVAAFLKHLIKDGRIEPDLEDEITRETLIVWNAEVISPKIKEKLQTG